jgi:superfamily II DNA/RNA helicase
MSNTFTSLGLRDQLVQALARFEIVEPFPIQAAAIPDALDGRDIRGEAPTGSGKTLAFGLPVLSRVDKAGKNRPRALVLAPTRELAEQISKDLSPLAKVVDRKVFAIYGGVGYGPQKNALRNGVDVLVATPGRIEDLIQQRLADLSDVEIVVVDEADRMADMGFLPAVQRILDQTKPDRQTFLFSATLDGDVAVLSRRYQNSPVTVRAGSTDELRSDATHHFWRVDQQDRVEHTARLIDASGRSIVFTRTRHGADRLARQLTNANVSAVAMHGGRSQSQRTRALRDFSTGKTLALVATDVAARGIHVENVASVIHYDLAGDSKDYLHRSGRTARAGAIGNVVTLVLVDQEREVRRMQRELKLSAPIETPQIERLHHGGHRIGDEPRSSGPRRGVEERGSRAETPKAPNGVSTRSILVRNLPWKTTERELETLFADHGTVERATIVKQKKSGRSKGFGFVDMSEKHATAAIEALRGVHLGGRRLEIRFAR